MIELRGVVKTYARPWFQAGPPIRALDGVDLEIRPGDAIGIIGLNGAGKSTLLRLLLGYVRPTAGTAAIAGLPPRAYVERHGVAYVPERVTIQPNRTVRETLRALAMMGDLGDDAWERVETAMRRLGLDGIATRRVGALSKGNVQRLAIAQAILPDRQVMILDEPTDGLDPVWISELRSILSEWRGRRDDAILVLASHNLAEVQRLTDRALLLHNGVVRDEFATRDDAGPDLETRFLARVRELEEGRP